MNTGEYVQYVLVFYSIRGNEGVKMTSLAPPEPYGRDQASRLSLVSAFLLTIDKIQEVFSFIKDSGFVPNRNSK